MKRFLIFAGLIKYKLSLAVTFSAVTGYLISGITAFRPLIILISGVFLLASGAAAINQYTERHSDAKMGRTMQRPIPQLKITPKKALTIALLLLVSGTVILSIRGIVPATLGVVTVILYNFIYTGLKRLTPFSLLPGALVGAIPPIIGFTAAGIYPVNNEIIVLSSFMFLWQVPHFLLIMIRFREEYQKAGFITISIYLDDKQLKLLTSGCVFFTTTLLLALAATGFVLNGLFKIISVACILIFLASFNIVLFHPVKRNSVQQAFIIINSFSLLIMILFIMNSYL